MRVAAIRRFPVKGLGAESLHAVHLQAGRALPGDRRYAIAHAASGFDPAAPAWLRKRNFLDVSHCPAFAALRSRVDERNGTLALWTEGEPAHTIPLQPGAISPDAQAMLTRLAGVTHPGPYRLASLAAGSFTDTERQAVSLINLQSLATLSRAARQNIDPLRFRANLWLDDGKAWCERAWNGAILRMGDCRLRVLEPITRCAAIEASPGGVRDMELLAVLQRQFGHVEFGVLAEVISDGVIREDDVVTLPSLS